MSKYSEAMVDSLMGIWDEIEAEISAREFAEKEDILYARMERAIRDNDEDTLVEMWEEYSAEAKTQKELDSLHEDFLEYIEECVEQIRDFHLIWEDAFDEYVEELPKEVNPLRCVVCYKESVKESPSDLFHILTNESCREIGMNLGVELFIPINQMEDFGLIERWSEEQIGRKIQPTWKRIWDP